MSRSTPPAIDTPDPDLGISREQAISLLAVAIESTQHHLLQEPTPVARRCSNALTAALTLITIAL